MMNKPQKPADLDNSKLHTREEYKAWQDANFAYAAALQAEDRREEMKAEAAKAEASRPLTEDEYYALAVEREAAKQAKQAERDAEEKARADEQAAYLAGMPEVAEIAVSSPYNFLLQICHWSQKGYVLPGDADITMLPTFYSVKMNKPAAAKKAK